MDTLITFAFYPLFVRYNGGIALLISCCDLWGVESEVIMLDMVDPLTWEPRSPYVGFSCVTEEEYLLCVPFMKRAKECGKTVLLGGVWAGLGKSVVGSVDWVCRGDGEKLPEFLLGGDTSLFDTPMVCGDLNSLPIPNYQVWGDMGEMGRFVRGHLPVLHNKYQLPYISSRGCTHRCSFCQVRWQPPGRRIRTKVAEDLSYIVNTYHPDVLVIGDAQLPYDDEKWRRSWDNFHHPFVAYIRADISEQHIIWLVDRGMVGCAFGIESGDERFRNHTLKKNLTDDQIRTTVGILRFLDIQFAPFYMNGVTGDTFLTRTRTCLMIREMGGYPIVWEYRDLAR